MARHQEHTIGQVRYFTYYLIFPNDREVWVDQSPFVGHLRDVLPTTRWKKMPEVLGKLFKQGEATWKDHNGVTHRVVVEDTERPRSWGKFK